MKILIIFSIILISLQPLKAEEKKDCSKLEKLKDKIGCKINSIKPEKLKGKKFSIGMPKVISEKKTLAEFFKKKD